MASSSVSQESLDMDDFDTMARRNRIRTHRVGRATPHRGGERGDVGGGGGGEHEREDDQQNGESNDGGSSFGLVSGGGGADHESPTRSAAARLKEKQRSRGNHLHKGKLPKDKRKLREKRRSTGVVHLPSTESTGDSLDDDDDDDESAIHETKKNTMYNEGPTAHSHSHSHLHHTHHGFEGRHASTNFVSRGNKSPSDLEADLEDNQDYDSTVSHSETNLTLIGRSESSDTQMASVGFINRQQQASAHQAKFSPEASRASAASASLRYSSQAPKPSEQDSTTRAPLASSNKYAISSLVSRYNREAESVLPTSSLTEVTGSKEPSAGPGSPRPLAGVSSVGVARDSGSANRAGERSYSSYLASKFGERAGGGREKDGGGGAGGNNSNGAGGGVSSNSYHSSSSTTAAARYTYGAARPFVSQFNPSNSSSSNSTTSASPDAAAQAALVEKQLDKEREENKRLQQQLEQKDRRIAELERQVALLNKECDELDEDNLKLQEENKALISAMQKLSTKV